ncbi:hypothetical protein TrCOL_g9146 [Triparma columacea]|uniref:Ras-related protein Rab-1 n=1 Tax=Triparma columacea TaxID=722753 RepID=A0A9W7GFI0_9STRA|nr:hypothetical protein TrCOL_g9146 [Triparma columacea]
MAAKEGKDYDMHIKLLMLGDTGVGKTCLLLRYAYDSFSPTFITTIGIDFKIKHVELDGLHVKLQIWDTAGQERFRTITVSYFKGAHGVALVYDVTDRDTFEAIRHWVKQIQEHAESNVSIVLIGNKCDKEQLRMVSRAEGEELAREINAPFFETSAKTNINVEDAFNKMAVMTKNSMMLQESTSRPSDGSLMVDDPNVRLTGSGKGGCC